MQSAYAMVAEEAPWFLTGAFFVLGTIVGSFLNVCIHRIPRHESVVHPGSRCGCGAPIRWHDNIPILGWVLLGGKARCCGRRFSARYPLVELGTGVLFAVCWMEMPGPAAAVTAMVFGCMLLTGALIDLDHMIIPDRFSVGLAVLGLLLAVVFPTLHLEAGERSGYWLIDGLRGLGVSVTGLLIGSALILWVGILSELVLRREAVGFGDVKLMGGIGAFCGWQGAVFALFGGAVIGTVVLGLAGVLRVLRVLPRGVEPRPRERVAMAAEESPPQPGEIPFGPALAAGAILYHLALREAVDAHFAEISRLLELF